MKKRSIKPRRPVHPSPAALITSISKDGGIIVGKLDPLCYLHGEYWPCGTKLGSHGYTRK